MPRTDIAADTALPPPEAGGGAGDGAAGATAAGGAAVRPEATLRVDDPARAVPAERDAATAPDEPWDAMANGAADDAADAAW
ncbi:MAG: hypothetical protein WAT56_15695, partial [Candidatus Microthrix parvicella]